MVATLACAASATRVGVFDFVSTSEQPSLGFLSSTLPAALSEPLSSRPGVQLVERSQLDRVASERGAQLSGLLELPDSLRPLLPADALVLGRYGGRLDSLWLQVRVVDVGSGEVKGTFSRSAPLQEILAGMSTLASQIELVLGSDSSARLDLVSDPPGAVVHLDGRPLGRTPIADQRIPPGRHELSVSRTGRVTWTDTIAVEPSSRVARDVTLPIDLDPSGLWVGGGASLVGITRDFDDPVGPRAVPVLSALVRGRRLGLEFGISMPTRHHYAFTYPVPMGERGGDRALETSLFRVLGFGDVLQAGRWNMRLGAGFGIAHCAATPDDPDTPSSRSERDLPGAALSGGVGFRPFRNLELQAGGDVFASPREIAVTEIVYRDLFGTTTDSRQFAIQLWSLRLEARIRFQ